MAPAVAAVALAAGGLFLAVTAFSHASPPPSPSAADAAPVTASPGPVSSSASSSASSTGGPSGDLHAKTLPRSTPVRLMIPSIGVDTGPLVGLGVDSHGALEVPRRYEQAGWYIPGLAPGQYGPAVIAGHVDSTTGPAVFYWLSALHTGAVVTVRRGHLALAAATAGDLCRFGVHTAARCRVDAEVIPVTRRLHAERITAPMADASTAVSSDSLVNLLRVYWSGRW